MNNEKDFDEAIEKMEVPQVDLNESDFGLTEERDSQQPQFAREYLGCWVDSYDTPAYMRPQSATDGYNIPIGGYRSPTSYEQRFTPWDNPYVQAAIGRGYERSMYHRDEENPRYHVRPEVINIDRDFNWMYSLNSNPVPYSYRPATVKFVVRCPSCSGTNKITVSQDILLRNPDPHITCICGAELIIEGRW